MSWCPVFEFRVTHASGSALFHLRLTRFVRCEGDLKPCPGAAGQVTMADLRELEVRAAKRMDKHFEELLTAIHSLAAAKTGGLTPQG